MIRRCAVVLVVSFAVICLGLGAVGSVAAEELEEIEDWNDLDDIEDGSDGEYVLVDDLDSEAEGYNSLVDTEDGFEPIADFEGEFDGQDNTIEDLYIDRSDEDRVGLFASTAENAEIRDLELENVNVTGEGGAQNNGVGSLVGFNEGDITNVSTSGDVESDNRVGGLVGRNNGDVSKSYATGEVSSAIEVGGLVGWNDGDVSESYATGDGDASSGSAGGLVGWNNGDVDQSYATGNISGGTPGGLVGTNNGDVSDSYWDDEAATVTEDGEEQDEQSDGGEPLTTAEMTGEDDLDSDFESDFDLGEEDSAWETNSVDEAGGFTLPYPTLQENTQDPPASQTLYADGGGDDDPYVIDNWDQLHNVRENLDADFVLANELNESTDGYDDLVDTEDGFEPIAEFDGEFDGQDNTIEDLYIDLPDEERVGLFASTEENAEIRDLQLENVDVTGEGGGEAGVGSLVGLNQGTITNVSTTGEVSGEDDRVGGLVGLNSGEVSKSYTTGDISGEGNNVGGLVGENTFAGDMSESYTTGNVSGDSEGVGGLVGVNSGDVSESYATGDVEGEERVGGFAGLNANGGYVSESYATGNVEGNEDVGGLVGAPNGDVSESYWDDEAATVTEDGEEQDEQSDGGEPLTTAEMTGDNAEDNMFEDFGETWDTGEADPEDGFTVFYPVLQENTQDPAPSSSLYADGDGDDDPYEITNWYELDNVRANLDANFTLAEDIDEETAGYGGDGENGVVLDADGELRNGDGFEPIGDFDLDAGEIEGEGFEGTFDGGGKTIEELSINDSDKVGVGLFGFVEDGSIENVALENVDIEGFGLVGGLVGYHQTTSENDQATIENSYVTGNVSASEERVGGLVGDSDGFSQENNAIIEQSYATGNVSGDSEVGGLVGRSTKTTISASYADSDLTGNLRELGGLVGTNFGSIETSYATGNVTGEDDSFRVGGLVGRNLNSGAIDTSYAIGDVTGDEQVGGLVGENADIDGSGDVFDSYATGDVHGSERVGGLVGENDGTVSESYAAGSVDPDGDATTVGGLIGNHDGDDVTDSYWDRDATGQDESDGSDDEDGLETAEMTGANAEDNMAGFGFNPTWDVVDEDQNGELEVSYPFLVDNEQEPAPGKTTEGLYAGGEGTDEDPYLIENWEHLDNVRENLDSEFALNADLDDETDGYGGNGEDGVVLDADGDLQDGDGFDPIDNFEDEFDGQDNTIEDLYINRPGEESVGLFASTGENAEIRDLRLENVDVTGEGGNAGNGVGSLVGLNQGTITNVSATGNVNGKDSRVGGLVGQNDGDISESSADIDVDRDGDFVGGLVGANRGDVSKSYATGDVSGDGTVGGLVGTNPGDVSKSYATGDVSGDGTVGGLVAGNNGDVSESYATGNVEGDIRVGGLVAGNNGDVSDSYWDDEAATVIEDGDEEDDQSVGEGDDDGVTPLTTSEMTGANATDNIDGFAFPDDEGTWHATDSYPALAWEDTDPFYEVTIEGTNSPIEEGETLDVTTELTNLAADGEQTIELLDFDGDQKDSAEVTLDSGDSTEETLAWETTVSDAGTGDVTVESDDDTASEEVTIEAVVESLDAETDDEAVADGDDEVTFTVTAEDSNEEPIEGITIEVTDSEDVADLDGIESGEEATTDEDGEATFTATSTDTGEFDVEFEDQQDENTVTATATFVAGDADSVTVETQPDGTIAGESIEGVDDDYPEAEVTDESGNPVEDVDVTVEEVGIEGGTIDEGDTAVVTDGDGIATFDDLVIEDANEGYELEFSIDSEGSENVESADTATTDEFEVAAADADSVEVETQPDAEQTAGEELTGQPEALATDEFENPVDDVDVTVEAGGVEGGEIDDGETEVNTDSDGIATFDDLVIEDANEGYELEFSIDSEGSENVESADTATTEEFEVAAADADSVEVETQPDAEQTAGEELTGQPEAEVTDEFENPIEDVDVSVEVGGVEGGEIDAGETEVDTDGDGIATFEDLVIEDANEGYELEFSIDSEGNENVEDRDDDTTTEFDVESADANSVDVETQPDTEQTAGEELTGPPEALATDEFENPVEGVDVEADEVGIEGGTIDEGETEVNTDSDGIATFDDLVIETADENYELEFSIDSEGNENVESADTATTDEFEVEPTDAEAVAIAESPDTITAGDSFEMTIEAEDEFGNPAADQEVENVEVDSEFDGTVFGPETVTLDGDGEAEVSIFENEVVEADGSHTLTADADDVAADSVAIEVEPAAAETISDFEIESDEFAYDAESTTVAVEAADEFGNPVENEGSALTLDIEGEEHSDEVTDVDISDRNAEVTIDDQDEAGADDLATAVGDLTVTAEIDATAESDDGDITVHPDGVFVDFEGGEAEADESDTEDLDLTLEDADGTTLDNQEIDEIDVEYTLTIAPEGYEEDAELDGQSFTGESDSVTIGDVTDAEDTLTFATTRAGLYTIEGDVQPDVEDGVTQDDDTLSVNAVLDDFEVDDVTIEQGESLDVEFSDAEDLAGETFEGEEDVTIAVNEFDGVDEDETITVEFDADGASTDEALDRSETEGVSAATYENIVAQADDVAAEETFDVTVDSVLADFEVDDVTIEQSEPLAVDFSDAEDLAGETFEGEEDVTVDVADLDGVDEAETVTVDFDSDGASTDEVLDSSEMEDVSAATYEDIAVQADDTPAENTFTTTVEAVLDDFTIDPTDEMIDQDEPLEIDITDAEDKAGDAVDEAIDLTVDEIDGEDATTTNVQLTDGSATGVELFEGETPTLAADEYEAIEATAADASDTFDVTVEQVLDDLTVGDETIEQGDPLELAFSDAEDLTEEPFEGEADVTIGVDDLDGVDDPETVTVDFDANGESTDEVLDSSETESVTQGTYDDIDAAADDVPADDTFSVTVAGVPETIDADVTDDEATADGDDEVEFTVTLVDTNGDPIEGETVTVEDAGDIDDLDGIEAGDDAQTDADGEATFTATSTDADERTLTFAEQTEDISDDATATFVAGEADSLEIIDAPETITAGDSIELSLEATDEFGNPAADQELDDVDVVSEFDDEVFSDESIVLDEDGEVSVTVPEDEAVTADPDHTLTVDAASVDSESVDVAVEATDIDSVEIEPESDQTIEAADLIDFDATAFDEFNNVVEDDDGAFTWTNADDYDATAELDGTESDPTTVTVEPAAVDSVEIEPESDQTIEAGDEIAFDATAFDEFDNEVEDDDSAFTWTNADEGTFDETDAGDYDVTAELDGSESDPTEVTVEAADVDAVEIEPEADQTIEAGDSIDFDATAFDEFDNVVEDDETEFEWANAADGTFERTEVGEYAVTAELNGVESAPTTITVEAADVERVELEPETDQSLEAGETLEFSATAFDGANNVVEADGSAFTWDAATGSISDDGLFDETTAGAYDVTAELDGVTAEPTTVTVEAGLADFDLEDETIKQGEPLDLTVTDGVDPAGTAFTEDAALEITTNQLEGVDDDVEQSVEFTDEGTAVVESVLDAEDTVALADQETQIEANVADDANGSASADVRVDQVLESFTVEPTEEPIDPTAPLTVDITDARDTAGGDFAGTVDLTVEEIDGENPDTPAVELTNGSATEIELFDGETPTLAAGSYEDIEVTAGDADDTFGVTVLTPADPVLSDLEIADEGAEATITEGTEASVAVTVENIGEERGSFDVSLTLEDGFEETATTDDLAAGEDESVSFQNVTGDLEAGSYEVVLESGGVTANGTLTVEAEPFFDVTIDEIDDRVEAGEVLELEYTLENTGDLAGTQDIDLLIDGSVEATDEAVDLEGGANTSGTLTYQTDEGDRPDLEASLETDDDTATETVTVDESLEEAFFAISIDSVDDTVEPGEAVTVDYTVENTGEETDTQAVDFVVDGSTEATDEAVNLEGGSDISGTFAYETSEADTPSVDIAVETDDDTVTETVTVDESLEEAFFDVSIDTIDDSVDAGETVTVDYAVENTGEETDTQDVAFLINDSAEALEEDVTLEGESEVTGSFTYDTSEADIPAIDVTVETENTSETDSVAVIDPGDPTLEIEPFADQFPDGVGSETYGTANVTVEETAGIQADNTTVDIELEGDKEGVVLTQSVDPGPLKANATNVSVDVGTIDDPDEYTVTVVASADGTESVTETHTFTLEVDTEIEDEGVLEIPEAYEVVDSFESDETAIEVTADDVTIDGNNHTVLTTGDNPAVGVEDVEGASIANLTVGHGTNGAAVAGTTTIENLTVGDLEEETATLGAEAESVTLGANASPPAGPDGYVSLEQYFEAEALESGAGLTNLEVEYDSADADEEIDEPTTGLWKHDGSEWSELEHSSVDTDEGVVQANVTEFSTFGVFADEADDDSGGSGGGGSGGGGQGAPAPQDTATFELVDIDVSETTLEVGDSIDSITAEIENTGDASGETDLEVRLNGDVLATQTVELEEGTNETIELTDIGLEAFETGDHEYTIAVDDDQSEGTLTIESGASTLAVTVTDDDGTPLGDVTVDVGEQTVTSDDDGLATFNLEDGEYSLEATADGFETVDERVSLDGDSSVTVALETSETEEAKDDGIPGFGVVGTVLAALAGTAIAWRRTFSSSIS